MWCKGVILRIILFYVVDHKFASRVLLFQDAFIFQNAIALCCSRQFVAL
jgi:hypothetical protein